MFLLGFFKVRRADPLWDTPPSKCGLKVFGGGVIELSVLKG